MAPEAQRGGMQTISCSCAESPRRLVSSILTTSRALDWNHTRAAAQFAQEWEAFRAELRAQCANAAYLFDQLPDPIDARVSSARREIRRRLTTLDALVDAALHATSTAAGARIERELAAFISVFFVHLLDIELLVMPAARRRAL